jgi:hypothetical protein
VEVVMRERVSPVASAEQLRGFTDVATKVRPYFLETRLQRMQNASSIDLRTDVPTFGDTPKAAVSWRTGGNRMSNAIAVNVLGGAENDVFYAPSALFMNSALKVGGEPIFSPPPFAAPCTDGLLIIYTLRRSSGDCSDVHGGYILITTAELAHLENEPIGRSWQRAEKPADCATMLKTMGFGETRPWMLN